MAELSTKDINDLPDSDFAYIEPGGTVVDGKTEPRSLRHFPIHDAAHVRNALARASQSPFGEKAMPKIKAAAKRLGVDVAEEQQESGKRSEFVSPFENGGLFVRSMLPGPELVDKSGMPQLVGTLAVFDEWAEIKSSSEGRFLERFDQGAFTKTLRDNKTVPVMYQHGQDPQVGPKPLGVPVTIEATQRGVDYVVDLFDVDYVRSLLPALKAGKAAGMGSSFTFRPVKDRFEIDEYPKRSSYNPDRLPEVVHHEVRMLEFGPGVMPYYQGTSAGLRSGTDELIFARFAQDPDRLRSLLTAVAPGVMISGDRAPLTERAEHAAHSQREAPLPPKVLTDEEWQTWLSRSRS